MDLVRLATGRTPRALALDDGGDLRVDYAELDRRVSAVAGGLAAHGVGAGDRVAMLTDPRVEQVIWIHAVWRVGGVVVPLHPRSTRPELSAALSAVQPALVVTQPQTSASVSDVSPVVDGDSLGAGPPAPSAAPIPDRTPADPAAILWTSGTAGRPRGVAVPWRALLFNAEASRARLGLEADDRWYASLNLSHVGGLVLVARAAALGSAVVLPGPFSAPDFSRLGDEGRITHASLVPVMLERILSARGQVRAPTCLRALLLGGGAAAPDLVERACRLGYPVAPTYGLSEATSQVATATPSDACRRPDAVGEPLPGLEVRVAPGGDILVRGPSLASHYVGDETPLVAPDGWLHTGDLGELGPDGVLRVIGRRGDRVVTGGVSVDPQEVEAELRRIEGIEGACVLGVPDPDWGERLVALVELDEAGGAALVGRGGSPIGELGDMVRARLKARLQPAKVPKEIHLIGSLPRNRNGKLDRAAARKLVPVEPGRP